MRDAEIRAGLVTMLAQRFARTDSLIIDELALCQGDSLIDIIVVNHYLHGFEIKSDKDTLDRLPRQREVYDKIIDYMHIVVGPRRVDTIENEIPDWWGIYAADQTSESGVELRPIRKAKINRGVQKEALAQLLWKDEVLNGLKLQGQEKGMKSLRKALLYEELINLYGKKALAEFVRETLKDRIKNSVPWRSDALQKLDDDLFLLSSRQLHCPC